MLRARLRQGVPEGTRDVLVVERLGGEPDFLDDGSFVWQCFPVGRAPVLSKLLRHVTVAFKDERSARTLAMSVLKTLSAPLLGAREQEKKKIISDATACDDDEPTALTHIENDDNANSSTEQLPSISCFLLSPRVLAFSSSLPQHHRSPSQRVDTLWASPPLSRPSAAPARARKEQRRQRPRRCRQRRRHQRRRMESTTRLP